MKPIRKWFAVIACFALIACAALPVCAEEDLGMIESVEGLRWFPVPEQRQNDDAWEAECVANGCLCQRFTETAEDTGNTNFLDTAYTAEGGLTLTRNNAKVILGDVDYTERYWPRVRTLSMETAPAFDLRTANTVYFDIEVQEGTEWNLSLSINGMNFGIGKFMAAAGGADIDPMVKEIADAPAGRFKGSVNVTEILDKLAADPNQYDSVNAQALINMKKTFVPQVQIYCVGGIGASLTVHELYMSTPEDTAGENCTFVDMGLLTGIGEEYYDILSDVDESFTDEDTEGEDTVGTVNDESDEPNDAASTDGEQSEKSGEFAFPWVTVILIAAVVAIAAAVVVIVVLKKKT